MCATCGCGGASVTNFDRDHRLDEGHAPAHDHAQGHADGHDHPHDHAHDPSHSHEHPHPDAHLHGHDHAHSGDHSHGHDHPDAGDHPHEHDHPHVVDARPSPRRVAVEQDVLAGNNRIAERNRGWLDARGILALNLVSSPGAGKTTLLERTIRDLADRCPLSVIEGDQETARDAERIRAAGCRVVQINTGSGCHLDADMIARGLRSLDPPPGSIVAIENVGNLVCPALFDLGERSKVVIASVTEGEDKPLKYPHMFRAAELMLLNKIDLLPHVRFDVEACLDAARRVHPGLTVIPISATRGDGLEAWYRWLGASLEEVTARA